MSYKYMNIVCADIHTSSRIAGCQVPKPRCLSPAANSMYSRLLNVRCLSLGA